VLSNFLEIFLLISPVFILIILGNLLRRIGVPELSFWHASDKLIYWVLIPALLFHHVSQITLSSIMIANYAVVILSGLFVVTTLSFIAGKLFGYTPQIWTSLMQGAARHNAFIALAIAGSLFGNKGLALGAIFMVILIPIINIVIVSVMASTLNQEEGNNSRSSTFDVLFELIKNPFILAIAAGLVISFVDAERIIIIHDATGLLGSAALPIMLLSIGANIKIREISLAITPIIIANVLKLLIFPIVVFFVAKSVNLSLFETTVAVIFAAVPTAASSYSLAKQFGGETQLMTSIITIQVALSFITIPIILAFIAT
jgi:predicted permease